ncbi:MAG: aspartate kinase, partial [Lachnospiraceae bacterium]|nr:aspartate kinase [Lachnospiraceae bacterium]
RTTSRYGDARLKRIDSDRILHELEDRKIVIVTGFQGINKYDDYTTLGRGGSDTTAVALAAALHADACEIYTDVDGVFTADPRICKRARKLKEITYDEMLDLASLGAGVLHNRSVEMAKKYGVTLVVRSSLNRSEGTILREETTVERMLISGVALDKSADRISVLGLKDRPGVAFRLFDIIAKANINIDVILQSIGRDGTKDISFTLPDENADEALEILEANKSRLQYQNIDVNKNVAKLSIVGSGMMSNPGVAAKMFEALYNEDININMISTSEIRVTVLIDTRDAERAVNAVHDAFGLDE